MSQPTINKRSRNLATRLVQKIAKTRPIGPIRMLRLKIMELRLSLPFVNKTCLTLPSAINQCKWGEKDKRFQLQFHNNKSEIQGCSLIEIHRRSRTRLHLV